MPRIAGVDLSDEKRIDVALTALYGVGRQNVKKLLQSAKIESGKKVKDLTEEEVSRLQKVVEANFRLREI